MSEGWIHDVVGLMNQAAVEQVQDMEMNIIGFCVEFDATSNMCRALLPTRSAVTEDNQPIWMETGWMQVETPMVGNLFGVQYALKGGATKENPELGEQLQISILHRASGLAAVAGLTYNDAMLPPGSGKGAGNGTGGLSSDPYGLSLFQPGEFVIRTQSGSFVKFYANGDIQVYAEDKLQAYCKSDANIVSTNGSINVTSLTGNVTVASQQNITIEAVAENISINAAQGGVAVNAPNGITSVTSRDIDLNASNNVNLNAGGSIVGNAPTVTLSSNDMTLSASRLNAYGSFIGLDAAQTLGLFGGIVGAYASDCLNFVGQTTSIGGVDSLYLDGGANAYLTGDGCNVWARIGSSQRSKGTQRSSGGAISGPSKQLISQYFPGALTAPLQGPFDSVRAPGTWTQTPQYTAYLNQVKAWQWLSDELTQAIISTNPASAQQYYTDPEGFNRTYGTPPPAAPVGMQAFNYTPGAAAFWPILNNQPGPGPSINSYAQGGRSSQPPPGNTSQWQRAGMGQLFLDSQSLTRSQSTNMTSTATSTHNVQGGTLSLLGNGMASLVGGEVDITTDPGFSPIGPGNIQISSSKTDAKTGRIQIASSQGPINVLCGTVAAPTATYGVNILGNNLKLLANQYSPIAVSATVSLSGFCNADWGAVANQAIWQASIPGTTQSASKFQAA